MIYVWAFDFQASSASFFWNGSNGGGIAPIPVPSSGADGWWLIRTRRRRG